MLEKKIKKKMMREVSSSLAMEAADVIITHLDC
jgi:hypothetical protein